MKILAIRFARLGDILLALPALFSLKARFPGSELTFMTGHRCAPIAELCPAIDHVISVDRVAMRDGPVWRALRDMAALVRDVRRQHFDLVVDLHSFRETNMLVGLSGAPVRIGMKRYKAPYWSFCFNRPPVLEDKSIHVAEMFQRIVDNVAPPGRASLAADKVLGRLHAEKSAEPAVALFVDAPVPERIWPPERFAEVADYIIQKLGARVIAISSPGGASLLARIERSAGNPDRISGFSDLSLPQLAAVIASTDLLISNDTGPLHIGPAVGVPAIGLFSVGYPEHFRPTGSGDRFLRGNPIEKIQVEEVIAVLEEMWTTVGRGLRR